MQTVVTPQARVVKPMFVTGERRDLPLPVLIETVRYVSGLFSTGDNSKIMQGMQRSFFDMRLLWSVTKSGNPCYVPGELAVRKVLPIIELLLDAIVAERARPNVRSELRGLLRDLLGAIFVRGPLQALELGRIDHQQQDENDENGEVRRLLLTPIRSYFGLLGSTMSAGRRFRVSPEGFLGLLGSSWKWNDGGWDDELTSALSDIFPGVIRVYLEAGMELSSGVGSGDFPSYSGSRFWHNVYLWIIVRVLSRFYPDVVSDGLGLGSSGGIR